MLAGINAIRVFAYVALGLQLITGQAIAKGLFESQLAQCTTGFLKRPTKKVVIPSGFEQRAQFTNITPRLRSYYYIDSKKSIYSVSYVDGETWGCRKIGVLNTVEDSCEPGYQGVCRGKRFIKDNRLYSLGCRASGQITENNPACRLTIEGIGR